MTWFYKLFAIDPKQQAYDKPLLIIVLILMSIGMVIVASASIHEGIAIDDDPFRFLKRQFLYIMVCFVILAVVVSIPMHKWYEKQNLFLMGALLGLLAVIFVGTEVNGAHRWLRVGPLNIQPSEFAKLSIILFLASYLVRRQAEVVDTIKGFVKPLVLLSVFALLLLLQPDLGSPW